MPPRARDEDPISEILSRLRRLLDSRDYDELEGMIAHLGSRAEDDLGPRGGALQPRGGAMEPRGLTKPRAALDAALAMDAAPSSAAGRAARDIAIERTAPFVGRESVLAQDSAEAVYRRALVLVGVSPRDLHAHALAPVFDATVRLQRAGAPRADARHGGTVRPAPTMATDGVGGASQLPPAVQRVLAAVRSLG